MSNIEKTAAAGPVQIVRITEDHKFVLDEKNLKDILYHRRAQGKKVALVSIAGDFRKGKSFMLDFFLRYLRSKDKKDWLGKENEPLKGFDWRGGAGRHTTGMLMWSEPFIVPMANGEEVNRSFCFSRSEISLNDELFQSREILHVRSNEVLSLKLTMSNRRKWILFQPTRQKQKKRV